MHKKGFVCTAIVFFALAAYSCTMPQAVEVKAHPRMTVSAEKDVSALFSDSMKDSFSGDDNATLYDCVEVKKPQPQTYLLQYKIDIDIDTDILAKLHTLSEYTIAAGSSATTFNLASSIGVPDAGSNPEPVKLDLRDMDDFLKGFNFTSVKAKLRVSGNTASAKYFAGKFRLNLATMGGDELCNKKIDPTNESDQDIPPAKDKNNLPINLTTSLTSLPAGGENLNDTVIKKMFNNRATPVELTYEAVLDSGEKIETSKVTTVDSGSKITMEILFWLPLDFTANPTPPATDAVLEIGDLFGDTDIFGSMSDMMHSAVFSLNMGDEIFDGKRIDLGFPPPSEPVLLENMELTMKITAEDMEFIKKRKDVGNPFLPKLKILFAKGDILKIPRDLEIQSISFDAEIVQHIDL